MTSIDLAWLEVFEEVYKSRSVSKAAERLGMTQGSTSTVLGKLRDYYGDRLFVRTARGVLPTPRADQLYPAIQKVRLQLEEARSGAPTFDASSAHRRFALCMTDISEIVLLPPLMEYLRSRAPNIEIEAVRISTESARHLEEGVLDLAVGFMPQLDSGFYQLVLFKQSFVCISSRSHPRVKDSLTEGMYLGERHVTVKASGTGHYIVDKTLSDYGMNRKVALQVSSFLGVAQIVAESELLATVPSHFARVMEARERIRVLPLPMSISPYQVKLHWHERFHADAANAWLRQVVSAVMRETKQQCRIAKYHTTL